MPTLSAIPPMSAIGLEAIEARLTVATYHVATAHKVADDDDRIEHVVYDASPFANDRLIGSFMCQADADLCAHAPADIAALLAEVRRLEAQNRRLLDALKDIVAYECSTPNGQPGELDSRAISDYADAMRLLAEYGLIEITDDVFRRVIGKWTNVPPPVPPTPSTEA